MADAKNADMADLVQELSIHGWPKLLTAPTKQRKLIWLICCCVTVGFFLYFAKEIISSYLQRETYISIKVIQKKEIAMPAMTFCNTNYMDFGNSSDDVPTFEPFPENCSHYGKYRFLNEKNRRYFEIGCKMFMANSRSSSAVFGSANFRFPQNFHFLPLSWPCFTLNRNGTMKQSDANPRNGMRMALFFNNTERHTKTTGMLDFMKDGRRGLYIEIHDPAEYYHKLGGISLMPGHQTTIKLKKKIIFRKNRPFSSGCYNAEGNLQPRDTPGRYTVENCRYECFGKRVYKKCGLVPVGVKAVISKTKFPTKNIMGMSCYVREMIAYNSSMCNCLPLCKEIEFETDVKYNYWPQEWQVAELAPMFAEVTNIPEKDVNIGLLRKHLIFLELYYGDMSETESHELEAYGLEKVLSDFGGQMGIFLGASLISLFEIVLLIITALWSRIKAKLIKGQATSDLP